MQYFASALVQIPWAESIARQHISVCYQRLHTRQQRRALSATPAAGTSIRYLNTGHRGADPISVPHILKICCTTTRYRSTAQRVAGP
eukprot:747149-Rhodomonas_salina.2